MGFLTDNYELEVPEEGESCDFMLGGLVVPSKLVCNPIDYVLDAGTPLGKLIFDAIHNCRCEEKGLIGQIVTLRDAIYLIINVEQNSIAHLLEITGRTRFCISKTVIKFRFELSERFRTFKDIRFAELVLRRNTRQSETSKKTAVSSRKAKRVRDDDEPDAIIEQEELNELLQDQKRDNLRSSKGQTGFGIVNHLLQMAFRLPVGSLQTIYEDSIMDSTEHERDLIGAFRCLPQDLKTDAMQRLLTSRRERSHIEDGIVVSGKRLSKKILKSKRIEQRDSYEVSIYGLDILQNFFREEVASETLPGLECSSRDQIVSLHTRAMLFDDETLDLRRKYANLCAERLDKSLTQQMQKEKDGEILLLRQKLIGRQQVSLNTWREVGEKWETVTMERSVKSASRKRHCTEQTVLNNPISLVYDTPRARLVLLEHLCSQVHERHRFKKARGDFYAIVVVHSGVNYVVLSQVPMKEFTLKSLGYTQHKLEGEVSFSVSDEQQREALSKLYMADDFKTLYRTISLQLKTTMSFGGINAKAYLRETLGIRKFRILPRFLSAGCNDLDHSICGFRGSFLGGFKNWARHKNRISVVTCLLPSRYADLFGLPFDAPNGLLAGQFDPGSTGGAAYARIRY